MLTQARTALEAPAGTAGLLADVVQENTGLYFDGEHLPTLLDKLEPLALAHGCRSFLDYYYLLRYEGEQAGEWQRVMDALSIQETYFWREMDQIETLVRVLVPDWFAKTREPLRIWSAACATGEEPFSIAIALAENGWFQRGAIEIIGSDACVAGLEKARRGIFRERSFRSLPPHLQSKYFRPVPQGWCIAPELLVRVRFQRANLVTHGEVCALATAPVIFCRNVFIYFGQRSIQRTVRWFAEGMPRGGHLFVGVSESLLRVTQDFELMEKGRAFVYVNKRAADPVSSS